MAEKLQKEGMDLFQTLVKAYPDADRDLLKVKSSEIGQDTVLILDFLGMIWVLI